jgi:hypothetical protein
LIDNSLIKKVRLAQLEFHWSGKEVRQQQWVIGKIAFEFPIHFPILLGGDVLGVMEFFSFTI